MDFSWNVWNARNSAFQSIKVFFWKKTKCWSDPYFWIYKLRNKSHFYNNLFEVILISEFTGSEIRSTSIFRYFCQVNRLTGSHDFISKNLQCEMHVFRFPAFHFTFQLKCVKMKDTSTYSNCLLTFVIFTSKQGKYH